jgi:signal transduction histidine kinase
MSYSVDKSYQKINYYFTVIVFITTIIVVTTDTILYNARNFHFLFLINVVLTLFLLINLWLFLTRKLQVQYAFMILLYLTVFNITLTHIYEFRYDDFLAKAVLIGLWGVLFVVLSGIVLGSWHPYLITTWAGCLMVHDMFRTDSVFLIGQAPAIIVTLIGLSVGINMYMKLYRKLLQDNNEILEEISNQKGIVEKQASELKKTNFNLNELLQIQKDLIEMIVHDMKNPLNSILNYSAHVPSQRDYKNIHEAGRQMLVLVENMLDVQRMENNMLYYDIEPLNLLNILLISLQDIDFMTVQRDIDLKINVNSDYNVLADREILIRIFINLLTNAIKHSPEGSCISIYVRQHTDHQIIISIKDQGDGIPDEYKDKVFEKFVQVISYKSGSARSTGLGLAFCKMSIEFMKGKIWIEDTSNRGTNVCFTLPEAEETEKEKPESIFVAQTMPSFSTDDVRSLRPVVMRLQELDVYKGGQIFKELASIDPNNKNLRKWVDEVKKSVYSVNGDQYIKMLGIVLSYKEVS